MTRAVIRAVALWLLGVVSAVALSGAIGPEYRNAEPYVQEWHNEGEEMYLAQMREEARLARQRAGLGDASPFALTLARMGVGPCPREMSEGCPMRISLPATAHPVLHGRSLIEGVRPDLPEIHSPR
ncbi:MAG: hypothetical protein FJ033_08080 [Chloroflexi bacterium]|nr:hypothetical protein [Chloroflexota bacterium]